MAQEQEIKEEITELRKQKLKLMSEIDALETELNAVKTNVDVKGKITLQCGTEIMIEPQFHLKLDPRQRINFACIYAILDNAQRGINRGDTLMNINGYSMQVNGREGPCQVIKLWERFTAVQLD